LAWVGIDSLRLAISAFLIHGFFVRNRAREAPVRWGGAAGSAAFLLIGLWTPIAGATAVAIELWMHSQDRKKPGHPSFAQLWLELDAS